MAEAGSPHAQRVLILANPKAGAFSRENEVLQLCAELNSWGCEAEVLTDIETLRTRANEAFRAGELRALVAAGGDGTVSLAANVTPPGVPITVFPLGTENLLARYFGLGRRTSDVCRAVMQGKYRRFDAGSANGRLFLLMAGVGFDAEVVRRMHAQRSGHIWKFTYFRPILNAICNYQFPKVRIYCFDQQGKPLGEAIEACWAFVGNFPSYAAGLQLVPEAKGDDGLLDLRSYRDGSLWHMLRYLAVVSLGRHAWLKSSVHVRASRIRIESTSATPYQLDGDPGGFLPLELEVLPGRLTLLAPAAASFSALRLPRSMAVHPSKENPESNASAK